MKLFASMTAGVIAAGALVATTQSADARGFYVDPAPPGVGSYTIQEYCRNDPSYRMRHLDRCSRYYDSGYDDHRDARHRHKHHRYHDDRDRGGDD